MSILLALLLLIAAPVSANEYTITAYAPLDPAAVRGMCYSGDPHITASGMRTDTKRTVAAPKDIPFGSWLLIEGVGWKRVDDRGGRIRGKRIDICLPTRREALRWGRRKVRVMFVIEGRNQA